MITIEEKLKLAEEVGANGYKSFIDGYREAAELSKMKFHLTTPGKIEAKLSKIYWSSINSQLIRKMDRVVPRIFFSVACLIFSSGFYLDKLGAMFTAIPLLVGALVYVCLGFETSDVTRTHLCNWGFNLPYGALLAVKEAKAAGIDSFVVWYPEKQKGARLTTDPVITGETKLGLMVEVFAWDDGKVYE